MQRFEKCLDWARDNQARVLRWAILFQMTVMLGVMAAKLPTLLGGETVLLRVIPVDPRDLFRGDYVVLGYDLSLYPGAGAGVEGQTIYAILHREPDGRHWKAARFSFERPSSGTYLRGKMLGFNRIEYGIESFYVEEGKGHDYEEAVRNRKLSAEVAVGADGKAVLKRLVIE
jgi:uncharacterized membrane-anchored protein